MPAPIEDFDGVVISGAGLVGSLLAVRLSNAGFKVKLFEKAEDWRVKILDDAADHKSAVRRSINLALSHRGRVALAAAGLEERVMKELAYPMRCRAMHSVGADGQADSFQPYDEIDASNAIYSVSREKLNNMLLETAEASDNCEVHFGAQVSWIDRKGYVVNIETNKEKKGGLNTYNDYAPASVRIRARLVVGADGAYSSVREAMLRLTTLNFERRYISAGYKEMNIPPTAAGEFALKDSEALHIWPRGGFMMIGLPNPDRSFTCTIFAPMHETEEGPGLRDIKTPEQVRAYFAKFFPDAVKLMPTYVEDFLRNPTCPLVTTRCSPWNIGDKIVLMGDSAHAMVPFYGQGMNSGFEDVQCFMETLRKHGMDLSAAVPDFAKTREPTGNAIADLSMHNFVEMRSHTASKLFLLRKKIEGALNWAFPTSWVPLYKMVAFTRIPYDECIKREERQSCLLGVASTAALVTLATVPLALWLRGAPEKGAGDARGVALVRKIARAFREAAQ